MCLAIPAKIVSIDRTADTAMAAVGEIQKEISLALVEQVNEGDYVLIHVGYALEKLDPEEAQKTLQLFAEMGQLESLDNMDELSETEGNSL